MESQSKFKYTKIFFSTIPSLIDHVFALLHDNEKYLKELEFICETGTIDVTSPAIKTRILAALHITSHHKKVSWFMEKCTGAEVSKALVLLDRSRKARQLEKKITNIENACPTLKICTAEDQVDMVPTNSEKGSKKTRKRKIDLYRQEYNSIKMELEPENYQGHDENDYIDFSAAQEMIQSASVSGSLARKVKQWAKSLKYHELQLIMLGLPKEPWRKLADIVHFSPEDFSDADFLVDIHKDTSTSALEDGDVEPSDSFVGSIRKLERLNKDDSSLTREFFEIAAKYPHLYECFSYIRTNPDFMAEEDIVIALAANIPIDTSLWYYEELHRASKDCQTIVSERLAEIQHNDKVLNSSKLTFGKLVERVLTFQRMHLTFTDSLVPLAKSRLKNLKEKWSGDCNTRFAVFGDASSSMQLAIEASTVFATMVSVCFNAELSFFSSGLVKSPFENPSTLEETFEICDKIRASGCTSLAAALWPYYSEKKVMDTFVLVTDEVENTSCNGYRFAPLLADYKKHVNEHVKLIIVRVGKGYIPFQQSLERHGIDYRVVVIDSSRPDLAKFDGLLGQLYMMTSKKQDIVQQGSESYDMELVELDSEEMSNNDFIIV